MVVGVGIMRNDTTAGIVEASAPLTGQFSDNPSKRPVAAVVMDARKRSRLTAVNMKGKEAAANCRRIMQRRYDTLR